MAAMQHVCVRTAAGESVLLPPAWLFLPSFLSLTSRSQTAIAGVEEVVLESSVQGSKWRWMERAGLELHVLSRDLPWRALVGRKDRGHYIH